MNDKFDELAKGMAQSVTRRGALKKFGAGLAGIALASLGLASNAQAGDKVHVGNCNKCVWPYACPSQSIECYSICFGKCNPILGG